MLLGKTNSAAASKNNNNNNNSNAPGGTVGGECYDYRCGFCINGPNCKYKHVRRLPEDIETLRLPQWYFKKIKSVFTQGHVTNYQLMLEFLSLLS